VAITANPPREKLPKIAPGVKAAGFEGSAVGVDGFVSTAVGDGMSTIGVSMRIAGLETGAGVEDATTALV
jgi:hypothetical protein